MIKFQLNLNCSKGILRNQVERRRLHHFSPQHSGESGLDPRTIQNMFTNTSNLLLINGYGSNGQTKQSYSIATQLSQFASSGISLSFEDFSLLLESPQTSGKKVQVKFDFAPMKIPVQGATRGMNSNGQGISWTNCDTNSLDSFIFSSMGENFYTPERIVLLSAQNYVRTELAYSGLLPAEYFNRATIAWGGCGVLTTISSGDSKLGDF